jgi:Tfp pilus assembly pilus retraction ATPase PilT
MNTADLERLLLTARGQRASDVIITAGSRPTLRIDGLIRMPDGLALDRIIESVPETEQAQIRARLSLSRLAVPAQRLVRRKDGRLVMASEILHNTHAVGNVIRGARSTSSTPRWRQASGHAGRAPSFLRD